MTFKDVKTTTDPASPLLTDMEILTACNYDADEREREVAMARSRSVSVLNAMIMSSRITWMEYYLLACAKHGVIALSPDDVIPEFDLLVEFDETRQINMFAIANRGDPTRRVIIMGDEEHCGSPSHESFHAALTRDKYRVAGFLVDTEKRILQTRNGYRASRGLGAGKHSSDEVALHTQFDDMAKDAIALNASDIHYTMRSGKTEIAFRVNGDVIRQPKYVMTQEEGLALVRSIYNIVAAGTKGGYQDNTPKDGVIERTYERGLIRFRFSSIPIEPTGADVTLRIIPIGASAKIKSADQLGYSTDQSEQLDRMFAKSSGLILFNGTTGSGKSTSMANYLMRYCAHNPGKKVRTVEDPVEYIIPGAFQSGATDNFNALLRQLMRADPDVIMIGEIRDDKTAALALHAVRSGHLSISTLHANGVLIAYDRLAGMGVGRGDLASIGLIIGLVYQRLVKTTCPHCRIPAREIMSNPSSTDKPLVDRLKRYLAGDATALESMFWENVAGCAHCRNTGYSSRTICAEIMTPTPEMSPLIAAGDSLGLNRAWRAMINKNDPSSTNGKTAFEHALLKMRAGLVSPRAVESEFESVDTEIKI